MRLYSVYLPPRFLQPPELGGATPTQMGVASAARFVREGFSGLAFFFSVFWALAHGLWLTALSMAAALVVLIGVPEIFGLDAASRAILVLGYAVLCGLNGNDLRRWALEMRGYECVAVVAARERAHALLRFAQGDIEPVKSSATKSARGAPAPDLDLGPSPGFWS